MTVGLSTATLSPTSKMAYAIAGYVMHAVGILWVVLVKVVKVKMCGSSVWDLCFLWVVTYFLSKSL